MATEFRNQPLSAAQENNMNSFKNGDRVTFLDRITTNERIVGKSGVVGYVYTWGTHVNVTLDNGGIVFANVKDLKPEDLSYTLPNEAAKSKKEIKKIIAGNRDTFNTAATKALVKIARKQQRLTTDDIWAELARANPEGFNVEPRMMGGFMIEAQKQGVVKGTNTYQKSTRPECHKRPVKVWTSSLFNGR
jgi:hypothetical protein